MKGKIVLVPFPFDDLTTLKVRPAVCLTDPIGIYRHVLLAFITSQTPDDSLDTDILLDSNQDDFATTGLRVSSVLRLHRIMTVTTSMIRRELGELSSRMMAKLTDKLRLLFFLEEAKRELKFTYNKKTDLLYIRFDDKKQEVFNKKISDNIILDIGEDKRIIGIEILDASQLVHLEKLLSTNSWA